MSSYVRVVNIPNRATTGTAEIDTGIPSTGSGWQAKSLQVFTDRQGPAVAVLFDDTVESRYLTLVTPIVAEETQVTWDALPEGAEVVAVHLSTTAAISGTVTVALQRGDNVGSYGGLLFSAPIDPGDLTTTLVAQTLTGTAATLQFAAGQTIKLSTIAEAGASGGPVVARVEYVLV